MDVSVRWMDGSLSTIPACRTVRDVKLHLASAARTFIPLIVLLTDCVSPDADTTPDVSLDLDVHAQEFDCTDPWSTHVETRHLFATNTKPHPNLHRDSDIVHPYGNRPNPNPNPNLNRDSDIVHTDGNVLPDDVGPQAVDRHAARKNPDTTRPQDTDSGSIDVDAWSNFPESPNLIVLHDEDAAPPPSVRVVVNDVGTYRHIGRAEWKQYIQAHQNDRDGLERVCVRMRDYDWGKHASGEVEWTAVLDTRDDGAVRKCDAHDSEPHAVVLGNETRKGLQRFSILLDEQLWCSASQRHPTPFDFVCDCIDCLLSARANVDATDEDKWTPLMAASSAGNVLMASHLLRAKANVNAVDGAGMSPLEFAYEQGCEDMVRLLVTENADIKLLRPRADNWKKLQIRIQLIVEDGA